MESSILVGPQGSGKTSVGKILAKLLDVPFLDGDKEFEKRCGPISAVISRSMNEFRMRESQIIEDICRTYRGRNIVFSPGGGAVANFNCEGYRLTNVDNLRSLGRVVYILPSPDLARSSEILLSRVLNDPNTKSNRPKILCGHDEILRRDPLYRQAAHQTIYTGDSNPTEIAEEIMKQLRTGLDVLSQV